MYILNENPCFMAMEAKPTSHFMAQGFFVNQAIIQVFRACDQLSSLSGAEIWPTNFWT